MRLYFHAQLTSIRNASKLREKNKTLTSNNVTVSILILYATIKTPYIFTFDSNMKGEFIIFDVKASGPTSRILLEVKSDQAVVEKVCNTFSRAGKQTFLCSMTSDSKIARVVASYSILRGIMFADSVVWIFILEGYGELKNVLRDLLEVTKGVRVLKVRKVNSTEPLTVKQEQILKIALDSGFYDFPRKITEKELAKRLNVSQSSLSEVLRRAEKNIISDYFRRRGL